MNSQSASRQSHIAGRRAIRLKWGVEQAAIPAVVTSNPPPSIIRLHRSRLAKLAWIFGFGR